LTTIKLSFWIVEAMVAVTAVETLASFPYDSLEDTLEPIDAMCLLGAMVGLYSPTERWDPSELTSDLLNMFSLRNFSKILKPSERFSDCTDICIFAFFAWLSY
jgi:hypothetical protein